ncbi:hypothetical protein [Streptomyces sp. CA-132043]|uniref:hypothetical protein n=1 Tax=Streptomyces sp. CA-132043 TaxID=3240048 RepID=UPI003D8B19BA
MTAASKAVDLMLNAARHGGVFTVSLYQQQERGQSAMHAGLLLIPMTTPTPESNLASAKPTGLYGPRAPTPAKQLLHTDGLLALHTAGTHTHARMAAALR